MMKNNKGFTLVELLVVVLIIGILAAMAMPAYFKSVERSRIAEAETLLGSISQAQQRRWMKNGSYSTLFSGLDVSPTSEAVATFCTKGTNQEDAVDSHTVSDCGNGFAIVLEQDTAGANGAAGTKVALNSGKVKALRVNNSQYTYTLSRYYQDNKVTCETGDSTEDDAICAEYCGLDSMPSSGACCSDGGEDECDPTSNERDN